MRDDVKNEVVKRIDKKNGRRIHMEISVALR
jgi:hypothetical protein